MENVYDALILAFAVMVFTIALSVSMNLFSKARQTSDIVLSTVEEKMSTEYESTSSSSLTYRKVGMETVIPSLYRYYKENLTIVFLQGKLINNEEIKDVKPLPIYTSLTVGYTNDWDKSYTGDASSQSSYGYKLNNEYTGQICVFDIDEENARHEPFANDRKSFIESLLNGNEKYEYYYRGNKNISLATNPLADKSSKFLELISRESDEALSGNKTTKKTIITYIKYESVNN